MVYHKWTLEEEKTLRAAIQKYGLDWDAIKLNAFPDFATISLKNKFYTMQYKLNKQ